MDKFNFTITENNKILQTLPNSCYIGRQYDNRAQQLVFTRPVNRKDDNLILYFSGDDSTYRYDLGKDNNYILANSLTKWRVLELQVAFIKDNEETKHSSITTLRFGESLSGSDYVPDEMTNALTNLVENAWSGKKSEDGNEYIISNSKGKEIERLPIGGDSGGITNYSLLSNKPKINSIQVENDKQGNDYGLMNMSDIELISNTEIHHLFK